MEENHNPEIEVGVHILKKEVGRILGNALAGYKDDCKIKTGGGVFVTWGAVERDIYAAIDRFAEICTSQPNKANQADLK